MIQSNKQIISEFRIYDPNQVRYLQNYLENFQLVSPNDSNKQSTILVINNSSGKSSIHSSQISQENLFRVNLRLLKQKIRNK